MKFLILLVFLEVFGLSAFATCYGDDGMDYRYLVQEVCSVMDSQSNYL